jgi:hypothetical protein
VTLIKYLFTEVLDGPNAWVADGVTRALWASARDFADYVRGTAATRAWDVSATSHSAVPSVAAS